MAINFISSQHRLSNEQLLFYTNLIVYKKVLNRIFFHSLSKVMKRTSQKQLTIIVFSLRRLSHINVGHDHNLQFWHNKRRSTDTFYFQKREEKETEDNHIHPTTIIAKLRFIFVFCLTLIRIELNEWKRGFLVQIRVRNFNWQHAVPRPSTPPLLSRGNLSTKPHHTTHSI